MQRYHGFFNRLMTLCVCVPMAIFWLNVVPAMCDDEVIPVTAELAAQGQPDECFYRIGSRNNLYNHEDLTVEQIQECLDKGGTLKHNAGYLWGLTSSGDDLWIGTAANIGPVGFAIMRANLAGGVSNVESAPSYRTASAVYELDKSRYMDGEMGILGDYRPPRIFSYHLQTGELTERTPADPLLAQTYGLRSAGHSNGVALLAGPVLINDDGVKGINLFAFDTANKTYLGSCHLRDLKDDDGNVIAEKINNIRKWLEINGVLYTTVGTDTGGKVLRWNGSADDPFRFDVVGDLDDQGTELVYHENRLFILSWPPAGDGIPGIDTNNVCDIMMTKEEIPEGGLTAGTEFVSAWNVRDYEPDPIVACSYGLGAAISYDGYLYWGTMHVPMTAARVYLMAYPQKRLSIRYLTSLMASTTRRTAIFRAKNFASGHPEIELLYGDEFMYQYQPDALLNRNKWQSVPNVLGQKPLFGESGLGNPKNYYTWSMAVFNNQLYLGTFEAAPRRSESVSRIMADGLPGGSSGLLAKALDVLEAEDESQEPNIAGFNLYRFPDSQSPAILETNNGYGQAGTYGVRNLLVADGALYLGTASTSNLDPTGGWALFKITTTDQSE